MRGRESAQPLAEGLQMLLSQNGRRHQYGNLLAVHHGLERRAKRPVRFLPYPTSPTTTHLVHRPVRLHVVLDLEKRPQLVRRLYIGKRRFHLHAARGCP